MAAPHETEPLLDPVQVEVHSTWQGRARRAAYSMHQACEPLLRPNALRTGLLLLIVTNLVLLTHYWTHHTQLGGTTGVMEQVCNSRDCVQVSYELLHSMNQTADPCDDFYEYSTGGWRATHPIPSDSGLFGVGQFVLANNNKVLLRILEGDVSSNNRADRESLDKLRTFYGVCVDTKAQDKAGAAPLLEQLEMLHEKLHASKSSLTDALVWMHQRGLPALFVPTIMGDPGRAPLAATPELAPGGLGLPDRTYYQDKDAVKLYRSAMLEAVSALKSGKKARKARILSSDNAEALADSIIALEAHIAEITPSVVTLNDPLAIYNPLSTKALQELAPGIDWKVYFQQMSTSGVSPHKVVLQSPSYMKKLSKLLANTPDKTVHAYLYWTMVRQWGLFLGPDVALGSPARRLDRFANGLDEDAEEDRETKCLDAVTLALGYMSGRFYAKETFGPESKTQVEEIMESIRSAFYRRLQELPWLDPATRATAKEKAESIDVKIGYPTNPDSTSATAIRDWYASLDVGEAYFANQVAAKSFEVQRAWSYIGGQLNAGLLGDLKTSEVNAEYNAPQNEIVFPAGLLQPPYFHPKWPMYLQYGAFGTTAGHELSHAFDPSGRLFDRHGYLDDWWTAKTAKAYQKRQRCLEDQYANYTITDDAGREHHLQSKFTIGEDVADAGGLAQSYSAWKHRVENGGVRVWEHNRQLPGLTEFTKEQLFFLAYGAAWARNIRSGEAIKRLRTDPHAPTKYRVNGALVNFPPFAKAFGCKAGVDKMALTKQARCEIW